MPLLSKAEERLGVLFHARLAGEHFIRAFSGRNNKLEIALRP